MTFLEYLSFIEELEENEEDLVKLTDTMEDDNSTKIFHCGGFQVKRRIINTIVS